jgi:cyclic pyranopterin phosphate synthase
MVDVTDKQPHQRAALAEALVQIPPAAQEALDRATLPKGDPLVVAQLAGIAAAKQTASLITLCHPLPLSWVDVRIERCPEGLRVEAEVRTAAATGVEMEALTAAAVAALNLYDLLKAVSKGVVIGPLRLLEKRGGKSGSWSAGSP